jgi:hypothetical protein
MRKTGLAIVLLGIALLVWMTAAQADIVPNQGFEENNGLTQTQLDADYVTLAPGATNITYWTVIDNPVDYIGPNLWRNYNDRSVHLKNLGAIQTTLNTVAGWVYTLEFDIGANWDGGNTTKRMQVSATGNTSQDYAYEKPSWWTPGQTLPLSPGWHDVEYVFTATGTQTVLTFASLEDNDYGLGIDDPKIISVTTPLPGTLVLLGSGLLTLAALRRRLKG